MVYGMFSLEKNLEKIYRFFGPLRPDWGNTAGAAMAGLGSIGLELAIADLYPEATSQKELC